MLDIRSSALKWALLLLYSYSRINILPVCLMSLINRGFSPLFLLRKGRSPSAMSGTDTPTSSAQVRMRPQTSRRPRPLSIATTGVMSTSMYEKRSGSNATTPTRNQPHNGFDRCNKSSKALSFLFLFFSFFQF